MASSKEVRRKSQTSRLHRIADYWLVDNGNTGIIVDNVRRKQLMRVTEDYAQKILLSQLGFQYILPLNNSIRIWGPHQRRTREKFPFDFYCEKDGQKWFIDVTAYIKKVISRTPLWNRLDVKIGVLFIRRDLQKYCFKDATDKAFVSLELRDIGLEPIPSSEVLHKAWETRKRLGTKVKPLEEAHKQHISEALRGRTPWNKGKPTSDETKAKLSATLLGRPSWIKGLTKETDTRVAMLAKHRWPDLTNVE